MYIIQLVQKKQHDCQLSFNEALTNNYSAVLKSVQVIGLKLDSLSLRIQVTDFGLAHMKGLPGCDGLMHTKCGTLYYMAPEVLNNKHEYTEMCDVWSMGVIMYTL